MNAIATGVMVRWRTINRIPDALKDGRDVLLWANRGFSAICTWDGVWRDAVGREIVDVTHYADVERPAERKILR